MPKVGCLADSREISHIQQRTRPGDRLNDLNRVLHLSRADQAAPDHTPHPPSPIREGRDDHAR